MNPSLTVIEKLKEDTAAAIHKAGSLAGEIDLTRKRSPKELLFDKLVGHLGVWPKVYHDLETELKNKLESLHRSWKKRDRQDQKIAELETQLAAANEQVSQFKLEKTGFEKTILEQAATITKLRNVNSANDVVPEPQPGPSRPESIEMEVNHVVENENDPIQSESAAAGISREVAAATPTPIPIANSKKCARCNKQYKIEGCYKKHIAQCGVISSAVNELKCSEPKCGLHCNNPNALKRHLALSHFFHIKQGKVVCAICSEVFRNRKQFYAHKNKCDRFPCDKDRAQRSTRGQPSYQMD